MRRAFLVAATVLLGASAAQADVLPDAASAAGPETLLAQSSAVDYGQADWSAIVSTYVTADGGFRYEALRANAQDVARLETFVARLAQADPSGWSRSEQLAFWVNAYNALVIDSVLELWPVTNVLEEEGFFDGRTHTVAGSAMTLNTLENEHIRARFEEPRIHFVVNCASTGCPPLASEVFSGANIEAKMAELTRAYVRSTTRIDRQAGTVAASQLFEWFAGDFDAWGGGVRAFIAAQLEEEDAELVRAEGTALSFFPYDWSINAR